MNTTDDQESKQNDAQYEQDNKPMVRLLHHDYQDELVIAHPDEILTKGQQKSVLSTYAWSIALHVGLLTVFSISYLLDVVHYKTFYPQTIIQEEVKQQRLAEKKAKAEEAEKQRAEVQAATEKTSNKPNEKSATEQQPTKGQSKIEQELQETSNERPAASSLKSIDDDL